MGVRRRGKIVAMALKLTFVGYDAVSDPRRGPSEIVGEDAADTSARERGLEAGTSTREKDATKR
jgi:hypothetical protein